MLRRFLRGRLFPFALALLSAAAVVAALALFLPRLLAPLSCAERAVSLAAALFVLSSNEPHWRKMRICLLFLPWTGILLCALFRPFPQKETEPRVKAEGPFLRLAATAANGNGIGLLRAETAEYFSVGGEMRPRLLADLANAKERIWLEYYIVARGSFFDEIYRILREKAANGVDIRLIYDDFGCALRLPARFVKELRAAGVRVSVFRPVGVFRGVAYRDHRKIAIADGAAYTGGINLADEYVGDAVRFGHWKDTAVRVTGSAADGLASLFAECWNSFPKNERLKAEISPSPGAPCVVVSDGLTPSSPRLGGREIRLLISGATHSVLLFSPYLSLDDATEDALKCAAAGGLDVRLMIPHIPDKRAVFFVTRSFARDLERAGVKVREYTAGFLHAKCVAVDGKRVLVSSYNLDFRSFWSQAECGLILGDENFAAEVTRDFESCWAQGTPLPRGKKGTDRIARLFAPLV